MGNRLISMVCSMARGCLPGLSGSGTGPEARLRAGFAACFFHVKRFPVMPDSHVGKPYFMNL